MWLKESKKTVQLTIFLVLICIFFFVCNSWLYLFIGVELGGFIILIISWREGVQMEKLKAGYYLLIHRTPAAYLFLRINLLTQEEHPQEETLLPGAEELLITRGLSLLFLVKLPLYFFHLWLPKIHVEASTTASMLLASLLLKIGAWGFLLYLKTLQWWTLEIPTLIFVFGTLGVGITTALQSEIKSLVAFSSILHINLLFLGLLIRESRGKESGLEIIIRHGFTRAALFFLVGNLRHSRGSRLLYWFKGLFLGALIIRRCLNFHLFLNTGLPPSTRFWAEFNCFLALMPKNKFLLPALYTLFFITFFFTLSLTIRRICGKRFKTFKTSLLITVPVTLSGLNWFFIPWNNL